METPTYAQTLLPPLNPHSVHRERLGPLALFNAQLAEQLSGTTATQPLANWTPPIVMHNATTHFTSAAHTAPCLVAVRTDADLQALMDKFQIQGAFGASSTSCTFYVHCQNVEYELVIVNFAPVEPRFALDGGYWLTQRPSSALSVQVRFVDLAYSLNNPSHKMLLRAYVLNAGVWQKTQWVLVTAGLTQEQERVIPPLMVPAPRVVQHAVAVFTGIGPSFVPPHEQARKPQSECASLRKLHDPLTQSNVESTITASCALLPTTSCMIRDSFSFSYHTTGDVHHPNPSLMKSILSLWTSTFSQDPAVVIEQGVKMLAVEAWFGVQFNQDLSFLSFLMPNGQSSSQPGDQIISKRLLFGLFHHLLKMEEGDTVAPDLDEIGNWKTLPFHGFITKAEAESRLRQQSTLECNTCTPTAENSLNYNKCAVMWLLRLSEVEPSLLTLSFMTKSSMFHMMIGHCRPGDTHMWTGTTPLFERIPFVGKGTGTPCNNLADRYYVVGTDRSSESLLGLINSVLGRVAPTLVPVAVLQSVPHSQPL